mmetsp:Transcript_60329/g.131000  ORF Transcript_60329/g.131000 Transcript_60329/m.131000 type:complete len:378 (-) Transcript_60329:97-1230(-)
MVALSPRSIVDQLPKADKVEKLRVDLSVLNRRVDSLGGEYFGAEDTEFLRIIYDGVTGAFNDMQEFKRQADGRLHALYVEFANALRARDKQLDLYREEVMTFIESRPKQVKREKPRVEFAPDTCAADRQLVASVRRELHLRERHVALHAEQLSQVIQLQSVREQIARSDPGVVDTMRAKASEGELEKAVRKRATEIQTIGEQRKRNFEAISLAVVDTSVALEEQLLEIPAPVVVDPSVSAVPLGNPYPPSDDWDAISAAALVGTTGSVGHGKGSVVKGNVASSRRKNSSRRLGAYPGRSISVDLIARNQPDATDLASETRSVTAKSDTSMSRPSSQSRTIDPLPAWDKPVGKIRAGHGGVSSLLPSVTPMNDPNAPV